jgi:hypothetical protein
MTTSNKIIASVVDSTLFIPLECLHNHFDSITYVFKKDGISTIKQEIVIGETNANDAVVLSGLNEGDKIFLSMPGDIQGDIRLLPHMNGKRRNNPKEEKTVGEPVANKGEASGEVK